MFTSNGSKFSVLFLTLPFFLNWSFETVVAIKQTYKMINASAHIETMGPFRLYSPKGHEDKPRLRLGYLTGSEISDRFKNPRGMYYRIPGQAISGAFTLAVDEINNSSTVLPNHILEFMIAETYGQEEVSIWRTAELQYYNISAYIGPQETCIHEGRIAAAFNLPMISYVSVNLM